MKKLIILTLLLSNHLTSNCDSIPMGLSKPIKPLASFSDRMIVQQPQIDSAIARSMAKIQLIAPADDPDHDYKTTLFGIAIGLIPSIILLLIGWHREKKKEQERDRKQLIKEMIGYKVQASSMIDSLKSLSTSLMFNEGMHKMNYGEDSTLSNKYGATYLETKAQWIVKKEQFRFQIESFESEIGEVDEFNK